MQRNENAVTQEHPTTVLIVLLKKIVLFFPSFCFWIVLIGFFVLCSIHQKYDGGLCGFAGCGVFLIFYFFGKRGQQLNWRTVGCKMQVNQNAKLILGLNAFARIFLGWLPSFSFSFSFCFFGRDVQVASCVQLATAKAEWGLGIILAVLELFWYSCFGCKLCSGVRYKYSKSKRYR